LSYHRASEAAPASGAAPVTVCTNDLALCNLVEHALPISISKALGNVELLVSEMVELENDRVGFAAVCARVFTQVGDQILEALRDDEPLPRHGLSDISPAVNPVVLLLVLSSTRAAIVVPLPTALAPPSEVLKRFLFAAAPASPHDEPTYRCEQTFPSAS